MSVLVVDKSVGPTSFAVVQDLRRLLGRLWGADSLRRLKTGHGGTLDPMASGVLPVCIGEATKLAPFLLDADKEYEASLRFGVETDTLDAEGTVVASTPVDRLTHQVVDSALVAFRGPIDQTPPMYSALKREGRPLYEYARAGVEVPRDPRPVTVHELVLTKFDAPDRCQLRVRCSKGTYVRVLAADLGRALGVGAHLTALRRTVSGPFTLAQALTLAELGERVQAGTPLPFVSESDALGHLPTATADAAIELALIQGKKVPCGALHLDPKPALRVRVLRADGTLLAVAEVGDDELVRTVRVFNREPSRVALS